MTEVNGVESQVSQRKAKLESLYIPRLENYLVSLLCITCDVTKTASFSADMKEKSVLKISAINF